MIMLTHEGFIPQTAYMIYIVMANEWLMNW